MKVTLRRTLGIIPAEQAVELEVDELPTPLVRLLKGQRTSISASLHLDRAADASTFVLIVDHQPSLTVQESQCEPEVLDALDDLWQQGTPTRRL